MELVIQGETVEIDQLRQRSSIILSRGDRTSVGQVTNAVRGERKQQPGAVIEQQPDGQHCRQGEQHANPYPQIQALPAIIYIIPMLLDRDQIQVRSDRDDIEPVLSTSQILIAP